MYVRPPATSQLPRRGVGKLPVRDRLHADHRWSAHPHRRARRISAGVACGSHRLPGRTSVLLPLVDSSHHARPDHRRAAAVDLRRNWFQKRLDFKAFLKESFGGSSSSPAFQNQHALDMAADADSAVAEAHGGRVHYCYLTMNVVIIEDDAETANAHAQEVRKAVSASRLSRANRGRERH